jgi:hypothetical protein
MKSSKAGFLNSSVFLVPIRSELIAHGSRYVAAERTWTYSKHTPCDRYPVRLLACRSDQLNTDFNSINHRCRLINCRFLYCNIPFRKVFQIKTSDHKHIEAYMPRLVKEFNTTNSVGDNISRPVLRTSTKVKIRPKTFGLHFSVIKLNRNSIRSFGDETC